MTQSLASRFASWSEEDQRCFLDSLSDGEAIEFLHDWRVWARPDQLEPLGDWSTWLVLAGRGWGKTRVGAEWVIAQARACPSMRCALVAPTVPDARDVMVEGESGIMSISSPSFMPVYQPSKRRIVWPNGAMATTYSADVPNRLRGPQHTHAWCDELASWRYSDTWDMLMMGLRLGSRPRVVVTTTPRPTQQVKDLVKEVTTHITKGRTFDNAANLAPSFFTKIISKYQGTRLGRQELEAEILEDNPNALFHRSLIDAGRVKLTPDLVRIVVAVDPAVSANADSDETGIVVAGLGRDGHGYVLDDVSGQYSPNDWAKRVVKMFKAHKADRVVAEINNGGDLVEANIRTVDARIPYYGVHASRGKRVRAEPVAGLYEQGKVHHVGVFAKLEDQMGAWDPTLDEKSPDRMDALVWALTALMLPDEMPRPRGVADRRIAGV